jgi:hypothetical protein
MIGSEIVDSEISAGGDACARQLTLVEGWSFVTVTNVLELVTTATSMRTKTIELISTLGARSPLTCHPAVSVTETTVRVVDGCTWKEPLTKKTVTVAVTVASSTAASEADSF